MSTKPIPKPKFQVGDFVKLNTKRYTICSGFGIVYKIGTSWDYFKVYDFKNTTVYYIIWLHTGQLAYSKNIPWYGCDLVLVPTNTTCR